MKSILDCFKQSKTLNALFLSNVFLSFHYALIIYINSSFLNNFFSETQISALYIIGSILNTLLLVNISKILNKIGNYRTAVYMIVFEALATIGIVMTDSHFLIGLYFTIHQIVIPVIAFNLDVFLESATQDEEKTGEVRSIFLTLSNVTFVLAPAVVAFLLIHNNFANVYWLSLVFMFPLYYLIKKYFKNTPNSTIEHIRLKETTLEYLKNKNLYNVFIANFLLQLFYAFMVVYTPLYLEKSMHFSWTEIGLMFTIMLLPFVIFEIPIGAMADKKYGEKEFLTVGFIIMGLSTMFISFVTVKIFWIWATILFITRIGASFVEVTTDSYFFKQVDQRKSDVISFYRITRPLAYIVAPILATVFLQFISFEYMFIMVGIFMVLGTRYSLALVDTK
ncbi:MAG: MFS transporter [bacterium]